MWRKGIWVSLVMLLCSCKLACGFDGVTFGIGAGGNSVDIYRVAVRKSMDVKLLESVTGYLTVGNEFSVNLWREGSKILKGIAWSPVFRYQFKTSLLSPFLEFGIGTSYFSDDRIGGRNLSTHFLFEDRIMLGLMIKEAGNILLGYMHYSNGGIKPPNAGMSMFAVQYVFSF